MRGARAGIRNADNLALKKENEELLRANEDWNRRFEGKERDLAQQQKARLPPHPLAIPTRLPCRTCPCLLVARPAVAIHPSPSFCRGLWICSAAGGAAAAGNRAFVRFKYVLPSRTVSIS